MSDTIPFNKPYIAGRELYYMARAVISNHRISGDGPFTHLCQQWLEKNLGCHKALLTHSCTAALEMSAFLCGVGPGDEVIIPSFTFVSTANAFVLRGATPVFVDIREDNLNLDEGLIEQALTPRTRAIAPVHYAGIPCDMDRICELARAHGLHVVEDAAQSLLSKHHGRCLGTIGDLGCLSFHETKNIISGEGGALLINDPELAERAEIIWEKGTNRRKFFRGEVDKYTWVDLGSSYLPSDLIAAFLYAQLEQAEDIIAVRRRIFDDYLEALKPLEDQGLLRLPLVDPAGTGNGHIMYLLARSLKERTALLKHLTAAGIKAIFHYVPLHSSPMGLKHGRTHGNMTVTDSISDRLLRLPLYYEMDRQDLDKVIGNIREFYGFR